jgi:hypothetical protein
MEKESCGHQGERTTITHGDLHELEREVEKRPSAAHTVSSGVSRYKKLRARMARTNAIVRLVER